ncbi:lipase family protein [Thalassolituus marinus]|uniref:Lipase family protein n=1 Tax=Thalassolituus marinus TaxID=671053 RepID=A0ABS7ZRQ4_9GAMM|nr:lipase family protein [Thalassolituus marinus]MCA6063095.1 lipase family protein [Thalassolituus marinus]
MNSRVFILLSLLFSSLTFAATDFATIQSYGQLAADTYLPETELEDQLKSQGQTLVHQAVMAESQVSYFLSSTDDMQTIAVRGTANLTNAMVDLDIEFQPDEQLGITLHKGFKTSAAAVYADVKPHLDSSKPITVTGHSLGGAIAVIVAMFLEQEQRTPAQVITFGQPKVTNVTGAGVFDDIPLTRVVTPKDIVPLVPPLSPLQIKDMDIYWHMGEEVILLGEGQYSQTSGVKAMLRATKIMSALPDADNLEAHKMDTYMSRIQTLQTAPVEVPYKMEISLFGLSLN